MQTTRILIVDDHPTFREGLRSLISHIDGMQVCAEADGESAAMRQLERTAPDLMIADLNLKDGSGLKLVNRARKAYPSLKILVASMYEESMYGERAIGNGANGYICKQDDPERLVMAIELVNRGEMFVSRQLAQHMLANKVSGGDGGATDPHQLLSDRELQVFELIGNGLSTKEIAARLHLSSKTIDTHRDHLKRKMGIDDNVRLVHRAVEWVLSR
jgi:DNA-binding NarL/FixJ family response regulator